MYPLNTKPTVALKPLATLVFLNLSTAAFSQAEPPFMRQRGEQALSNAYRGANPNFIPVLFSYGSLGPAPVSDREEFGPSVKQALEIRGPLARALYAKDVRLVMIEVEASYLDKNPEAGKGMVFTVQNNEKHIKNFSIPGYAFTFDRRSNPHSYGYYSTPAQFSKLGDPELSSDDALASMSKDLMGAVADTMRVPESRRAHLYDGKTSDEHYQLYLEDAVSRGVHFGARNSSPIQDYFKEHFSEIQRYELLEDSIETRLEKLRVSMNGEYPGVLTTDLEKIRSEIEGTKLSSLRAGRTGMIVFDAAREYYSEFPESFVFTPELADQIYTSAEKFVDKSLLRLEAMVKKIEDKRTAILAKEEAAQKVKEAEAERIAEKEATVQQEKTAAAEVATQPKPVSWEPWQIATAVVGGIIIVVGGFLASLVGSGGTYQGSRAPSAPSRPQEDEPYDFDASRRAQSSRGDDS